MAWLIVLALQTEPYFDDLPRRWIESADQLAEAERWGDLADLIDRVPRAALLRVDDRRRVPAREALIRKHLPRFREHADARARALFESGALEETIERFFLSSWGDDAAVLLANRRFAAGDAAGAAALWRRVLGEHPDPDEPAVVAARLALAGDPAPALARRGEEVRVGGRTMTLGALVESMREDLPEPRPSPLPGALVWSVAVGGSADAGEGRVVVAGSRGLAVLEPASMLERELVWSQRTSGQVALANGRAYVAGEALHGYDLEARRWLWEARLDDLGLGGHVLGAPIAAEGLVVVSVNALRNGEYEAGAMAVDARTGERKWYASACSTMAARQRRRALAPTSAVEAALAGDRVVIRTDGVVAAMALADGRVLWAALLEGRGAPAVAGGSAYCVSGGSVHALELGNGRVTEARRGEYRAAFAAPGGWLVLTGSEPTAWRPSTGEEVKLQFAGEMPPVYREGYAYVAGSGESGGMVARYDVRDWRRVDAVAMDVRDTGARPLVEGGCLVMVSRNRVSVYMDAAELWSRLEGPGASPAAMLDQAERFLSDGAALPAAQMLDARLRSAGRTAQSERLQRRVVDLLRREAQRQVRSLEQMEPYLRLLGSLSRESGDRLWVAETESALLFGAGRMEEALRAYQRLHAEPPADEGWAAARSTARRRVEEILSMRADLREAYHAEAEVAADLGLDPRVRHPGSRAAGRMLVRDAEAHAAEGRWDLLFEDALEATRPGVSDEAAWRVRRAVLGAIPRVEDETRRDELSRAAAYLARRRPAW